ncbi:hypothetical protein ACFQFG_26620 [Methylobacterium persicinum]
MRDALLRAARWIPEDGASARAHVERALRFLDCLPAVLRASDELEALAFTVAPEARQAAALMADAGEASRAAQAASAGRRLRAALAKGCRRWSRPSRMRSTERRWARVPGSASATPPRSSGRCRPPAPGGATATARLGGGASPTRSRGTSSTRSSAPPWVACCAGIGDWRWVRRPTPRARDSTGRWRSP